MKKYKKSGMLLPLLLTVLIVGCNQQQGMKAANEMSSSFRIGGCSACGSVERLIIQLREKFYS